MNPDTFQDPLPGFAYGSPFGVPRASGPHLGLDIPAPGGTEVFAPGDGWTVAFAQSPREGGANGGNVILYNAEQGIAVRMLHFDRRPPVQVGDVVGTGDVVGNVGTTGSSTGNHLHIEVITAFDVAALERGVFRSQGDHIDPARIIGADPRAFAYLNVGTRHDGVRTLQEELIAAGYDIPAGPTGYYGEQTEAAVRAFQTANGLEPDGVFGPLSRTELDTVSQPTQEPGEPAPGEPAPGEPAPGEPAPGEPGPTVAALDTPGPFAAVGVGELVSRSDRFEGGAALSSLDLEQTRTAVRAVFGDGVASETLFALGARYGDERTFLQRVVALGYHEGALSFGRANPDPAAGFNRSTFQEGGSHIETQAQSDRQFASRIAAGLPIAQELLGREIDAGSLTPAARDVMAFVGYRAERSGFLDRLDGTAAFPNGTFRAGDRDQLFELIANPTLTDAQVVEGMSRMTQGGIADIGRSVLAWTTPGGAELYINMPLAERRGQEPEETRGEPALGTLRRGDNGDGVLALQGALARLGYDLGPTGPNDDGVDGDFGDLTRAAVVAEQTRAGLAPDGVVGPATWGAIAARVSPEIEAGPTETRPMTAEEARAVLDGQPVEAGYLANIEGYVANLVNDARAPGAADSAFYAGTAEVAEALYAQARTQDAPLTGADVAAALQASSVPAELPAFQAAAAANGINTGVAFERAHPDVAEARATLREAEAAAVAPEAEASATPTLTAEGDPPAVGGDGAATPAGDGQTSDAAPELRVADAPEVCEGASAPSAEALAAAASQRAMEIGPF